MVRTSLTWRRAVGAIACVSLAAWAGCGEGGRPLPRRDGGGGGDLDAGETTPFDSGGPTQIDAYALSDLDAPQFNPFDPDSACASSSTPSMRVPGAILLVFDQSTSMETAITSGSSTTRWSAATAAINNAMAMLPDELNVGMALFPRRGGSSCEVSSMPDVPIAPLSVSRPMIASTLMPDPEGSATPIISAARAGWDIIRNFDTRGERAVIVVTDGEENCSDSETNAFRNEAADQLATHGVRTYAVGLDAVNGFLSQLAFAGGTRRTPTCEPACAGDGYGPCANDGDCSGGLTCQSFGLVGVCGCANDAACGPGFRCEIVSIGGFFTLPGVCRSTSNAECCHYAIQGAGFQNDFQTALRNIAAQVQDGCVYSVPRPASGFDPALVNVGVTLPSGERQVLPYSDDPNVDSWRYRDATNETIVIQGPLCDQIRMVDATVEIVSGCPTIVI